MEIKLDLWQEEVVKTKGNMCLRSGRQVGKSTVIGLKAAQFALENPKKLIMVISKTEKQAGLLFAKILFNLVQLNKPQIKRGKDRPTKSKISLKNGSIIHCLPVGDTGYGIMGFTIDLLIADEAAFIPNEVWNSIIPALAITRGNIWLLSTPFIREGYYYECFNDPSFTAFHTSSEDCPRRDDSFSEHKKKILTKAQYAQMYLGEFVDEELQFYPKELIEKCCTAKVPDMIPAGEKYIGCDVARMDHDEFTFEILNKVKNKFTQIYHKSTRSVPIPESTREIIRLNTLYNFKKEYIDSGGMGITVCDILRENPLNKRKVVEINNASRTFTHAGEEKKKGLYGEDLHNNLKKMMQKGEITLLNDSEVINSFKSVLADHHPNSGRMKFWGSNTHIVEGIKRAAWGAKDKHLKLYIF